MDKETKEKLQKALVAALEEGYQEEKHLQEKERKRKEKEPDNS